ncbi:hypothetical protein ABKW02_24055, partial [Enterobacter cloacae]
AIGQGGVIRLTALDRPAQVVHERFTHQVFREVTPGLSAFIQTYAIALFVLLLIPVTIAWALRQDPRWITRRKCALRRAQDH